MGTESVDLHSSVPIRQSKSGPVQRQLAARRFPADSRRPQMGKSICGRPESTGWSRRREEYPSAHERRDMGPAYTASRAGVVGRLCPIPIPANGGQSRGKNPCRDHAQSLSHLGQRLVTRIGGRAWMISDICPDNGNGWRRWKGVRWQADGLNRRSRSSLAPRRHPGGYNGVAQKVFMPKCAVSV